MVSQTFQMCTVEYEYRSKEFTQVVCTLYSLVFILRQQTCTLLLPISLTISISCTLFQELYNRFLSVFTLQLENPRNANKILMMSHCLLIYPELGWWHIC